MWQGWDRTLAIRYGGVLWVIAFVATWIEWGDGWLAGFHFVVMLCFYDGMLTYVEVNHSALLADITSDDKERTSLVQWSAGCATLGALTSVAAQISWDPEDMMAFRRVVIGVGVLSLAAFELTVRNLRNCTTLLASKIEAEEDKAFPKVSDFIRELASQSNFTVFLGTQIHHEFFSLVSLSARFVPSRFTQCSLLTVSLPLLLLQ